MTFTAPPSPPLQPPPLPLPPATLNLERRLLVRSLQPHQDAQAARIQAPTRPVTFGWGGPLGLAVATVDHLVRNVSEFGRCHDKEIGLRRPPRQPAILSTHVPGSHCHPEISHLQRLDALRSHRCSGENSGPPYRDRLQRLSPAIARPHAAQRGP